jgi:hypothetical protein
MQNYPEKIENSPGLSPRNFFEIPEGSIKLKSERILNFELGF